MLPIYYLLPLLSGFVYAVGALASKRGMEGGGGIVRQLFLANFLTGLFFLPLLVRHEGPVAWEHAGWALLAALTFLGGQLCTFSAIRIGDVSIQSPVMGAKVLFVALLSWVMIGREAVPANWAAGAVLTAFAVYLLGRGDGRSFGSAGLAVLLALAGSLLYALTDVLVQIHAPDFGPIPFMVLMMGSMALASFGFIPFFRGRLRELERSGLLWLVGGAALLAFQAIGMGLTLSLYGKATAANILYSSRGLWSVVLVWGAGGLFRNREREAGRRAMARRLVGAVLMLASIVLVLAE